MSETALIAQRVGEPGPRTPRSVVTLLRFWAPATVGTLILTFWALLQVSPDATRAAVVASVVVLALAAVVSSYVRGTLAELAQEAAIVQRRADLPMRRHHAERLPSPAVDVKLAQEIDDAVRGITENLTLIAEQWRATWPADAGDQELAAVEEAVAKAVSECNQITLGFGSTLPSDTRHTFNNAVMPLSYALDKAAKRLTRLLHRGAPPVPAEGTERVPMLLEGARASAERLGTLVRRLGTV